jgi:signal transduction histidine kinase
MNNQFKQTRLQLTSWYLVILMVVSGIFSLVVYTSLNAELLRNARREQQKIVADQIHVVLPKPLPDPNQLPPELVDPKLSPEIQQSYDNSRNGLLIQLLIANLIVLGVSATASYTLAGKTLKPIEQMLDDQKKFIANASHELRTPLTTLKTAIEVTLKMGPIPYERTKSIMESNLEDVNNLEELTNKLLIIEKYSNSNVKPLAADIRMDNLVKDCIMAVSAKAKSNHIKISAKTTPTVLRGNDQGLREMVTNFLDNAIKYNKPHGKVDIKLFKQNNCLLLEIRDTGIGIKNSDIPHIYERFFRADNSRSKSGTGGYGLGLSIASQIIKQHKGKISVQSILGKGTTFTVQLPLKKS